MLFLNKLVNPPPMNEYVSLIEDLCLLQNTQVAETKEFRRPFSRARDNVDELRRVETTILCYRGVDASPKWLDEEPGTSYLIFTRAFTNARPRTVHCYVSNHSQPG